MCTIRGVKDRRFKFTQILNPMFEDQNLSCKAKGFIGYCLTKPENWHFHISHLVKMLKEGEKAIYSMINECIEQGYALRFQKRREDGGFAKGEMIISDSKEEIISIKKELENDPDFKKMLPHLPFGDAVNVDAEEYPPSNTEASLVILKETTTKKAAPSAAASFEKEKKDLPEFESFKDAYPCLNGLGLSYSEETSLTEDYDEETVIQAIKVVTAPSFHINKNLIAALRWACKNKPPIPEKPEEKEKKNKDYAAKMLSTIRQHTKITMEVLNKFVEFVIPNGSGGTAETLYYTENGFEEQLKCKMQKFNLL